MAPESVSGVAVIAALTAGFSVEKCVTESRFLTEFIFETTTYPSSQGALAGLLGLQ